MTDLYLIAHKVHGEPAFDVAASIRCPECIDVEDEGPSGCAECDYTQTWWIVSTSGHRAYPYCIMTIDDKLECMPEMPEGLPDHYATHAAPTFSLTEALGLKPKVQPIKRRF